LAVFDPTDIVASAAVSAGLNIHVITAVSASGVTARGVVISYVLAAGIVIFRLDGPGDNPRNPSVRSLTGHRCGRRCRSGAFFVDPHIIDVVFGRKLRARIGGTGPVAADGQVQDDKERLVEAMGVVYAVMDIGFPELYPVDKPFDCRLIPFDGIYMPGRRI